MDHEFTDYTRNEPQNGERLAEEAKNPKEPKAPVKKKKPSKTASKPVKSELDRSVRSLADILVKVAALAVGLGIVALGINALLGVFGLIGSTPATNPDGESYTLYFAVPYLIMAITYGIGIVFGAGFYKAVPLITASNFWVRLIGPLIKIVIAGIIGYYVYGFALDLLNQLGWVYPVINGLV
jgi:hypothetical protein